MLSHIVQRGPDCLQDFQMPIWASGSSLNSFSYTFKRQQSSVTYFGGIVYHNSILLDDQHKKS